MATRFQCPCGGGLLDAPRQQYPTNRDGKVYRCGSCGKVIRVLQLDPRSYNGQLGRLNYRITEVIERRQR